MVQTVGDTIAAESLPESCRRPPIDAAVASLNPTNGRGASTDTVAIVQRYLEAGETDIYRKVHSDVDRVLLRCILDHVDGNQAQASQLLGISRSTLHSQISDLGMVFEKRVAQ